MSISETQMIQIIKEEIAIALDEKKKKRKLVLALACQWCVYSCLLRLPDGIAST